MGKKVPTSSRNVLPERSNWWNVARPVCAVFKECVLQNKGDLIISPMGLKRLETQQARYVCEKQTQT